MTDIKRLILTTVVIAAGAAEALAQDYTTTWPYRYSEFEKGVITFTSGKTQEAELNVHLRKGDLHFLEGEKIKCVAGKDIESVTVGPDVFVCSGGRMLKVVKGDLSGCIGELLLGDFEALMSGGGAYGTSTSTSATMKVSSMDVGGEGLTNISVLRDEKESGAELPVKSEFYIFADGKAYRALKKDIENALPDGRKEEFKRFVKENKIKWNSAEGLYPLVEFLKGDN